MTRTTGTRCDPRSATDPAPYRLSSYPAHGRLCPPSESIEQMDGGCDRESERRHDPGQLAAVLVGLGHHRVREHGEDRTGGEGENEGDGAR